MATCLAEPLHHLPDDLGAPFCHFHQGGKVHQLSFRWLLQAAMGFAEAYRAQGIVRGDVVINGLGPSQVDA